MEDGKESAKTYSRFPKFKVTWDSKIPSLMSNKNPKKKLLGILREKIFNLLAGALSSVLAARLEMAAALSLTLAARPNMTAALDSIARKEKLIVGLSSRRVK